MGKLGLEDSTVAGKARPVFIDSKDFGVFLAARMGALGLSTAALAEQLGVTPAAIYAMLSGNLVPGDKVAEKLGLRRAFVMDVRPDVEQLAKPARKK